MTDRKPSAAGKAIRAILAVQVAIALLLFARDLSSTWPRMGFAPAAPGFERPLAPGDQTRRFDPLRWPERPGLTRPAMPEVPTRLQFEPDPGDATILRLTGAIAPGDAQRFAEWLASQTAAYSQVVLHSPGGSVADALAIGRALREAELNTLVDANAVCFSACPYMLAGGVTRIAEDGALVGVHQHYFDENTLLPAFMAVEDIQRGQGEVLIYLIEMGVDPALMQHALVTGPDEIYVLTADELSAYRLAEPAAP
ncbi:MAG: hypothetical protein AAF626_16875 [Pseudomonadota bacterium]